jgi:hypothetical protein
MPSFRHQHGHFRLERTGKVDHFMGRRHFKIQLDLCQLTQATHIGILYVTTILAQMHGNAIGATQMGFNGCPDRIRFVSHARLAQRGHVIDIDAKLNHKSCNSIVIGRKRPW